MSLRSGFRRVPVAMGLARRDVATRPPAESRLLHLPPRRLLGVDPELNESNRRRLYKSPSDDLLVTTSVASNLIANSRVADEDGTSCPSPVRRSVEETKCPVDVIDTDADQSRERASDSEDSDDGDISDSSDGGGDSSGGGSSD